MGEPTKIVPQIFWEKIWRARQPLPRRSKDPAQKKPIKLFHLYLYILNHITLLDFLNDVHPFHCLSKNRIAAVQ